MSSSEIAFLVLGLAFGVAVGAAIVAAIRGRLAPRREVRVTIAPNAIPVRRASTLATSETGRASAPVDGSPEADALPARTPVPSAMVGIAADAVAIPIVPDLHEEVPMPAAVAVAVSQAVRAAAGAENRATAGLLATLDTAPAARTPGPGAGSPGARVPGSIVAGMTAARESCGVERQLVDERCSVAETARLEARRAAEAHREAQRSHDALQQRVEEARDAIDPRRVAEAKERLHASFRERNGLTPGAAEPESATRAWMDEISRLNGRIREAGRILETGEAELRRLAPRVEQLELEADAARITAEAAAEACSAAREELARCEEQAHAGAASAYVPPPPEDPHPFAHIWPAQQPALERQPAPAAAPAVSPGIPAVVGVLRGDRAARERLVAALAAGEPGQVRAWQLRMAALVDAIVARSIEAGYLDFPDDDPFWGLFTIREAREVAAALAALGFRYDGLGGFTDARIPTARDLSLAVGYAGLDRMRIRIWPREADLGSLFARVTIASDEWLADQAPDLALGRLTDALGARAAELAETWNAWGRIRPLLLAS